MPGNHAMSARERRGSIWDIRWNQATKELEATKEKRPPEPLKNRVLELRAVLREIANILDQDSQPPSTAKAEISSKIDNELSTLEWELLD